MPVFRLQKDSLQHGLANTIQHWGISNMYDDKQIDAIESSNKSSLSEPTSIPSPFARIALAKTAFGEVAEHGKDALSSYQKIVSDSLDVAEIFFTYDKWKNRIDIIKWDTQNDLQKLATHHKQLYKTLSTFLRDDSSVYNFDKMKCIYILKNRETGEMIGATSPSTLFFSSANKFTGNPIQLSNNHNAFSEILPLHQRSWEFQKYLYTWIAINKKPIGTRYNFDEVFKYLESEKKFNPEKIQEIDIIIDQSIESSLHQNYTAFSGSLSPEVLGFDLYKQSININQINSDFKINSKFSSLKSPLVLPLEGGNGTRYASWKLTENTFWANFKADINSSRNVLPEGSTYPWLSINDFLEDSIIKLPYEIKRESFFDGNLTEGSLNSYLLPIKEKYFQYFDTDDLKNHITIKESGNVVSVELKIPVLKGTVDFKKEYRTSEDQIITADFDCALFPNVKFAEEEDAFYRFGLVYDFNEKEKYSAEFLKINSKIDERLLRNSIRNESQSSVKQCKNYSLEGSNFDYIRFWFGNSNGVIVPKFEIRNCSKEFAFAIDFGTTNTHIEYKIGDRREIKPFDISKETGLFSERQIHWLHGGEDTLKYIFDEEYIPEYTGEEFRFPMRTALSYGENTNWADVYPFEKASMDELYEKRMNYSYNNVITDLKWSGDPDNTNQVDVYIKSIMYLLRNKVVLNNGSLKSTIIKWFYPVSMEKSRYDNLKNIWIEAYGKYFGGRAENVIAITESVAPFEYFLRDGNANNIVSIDIGGGTTDILIAKGEEVNFITSFKFAANSIFGDGYSENNRTKNGIVRQFTELIKDELLSEIDENDDLFKILDDINFNRNSSDIASFLFSLQNNKKVLDAGESLAKNVSLSEKLKNDTSQTITFIFFYAAIIYHLAKIIKTKKLQVPDKIVFSGNGSRVVSFLTKDVGVLKDYTKLIFEEVLGETLSNNIDIIINKENPKEATCKGGLLAQSTESFDKVLQKRIVLHSSNNNSVIHFGEDDFKNRKVTDTYKTIDEKYLKDTEKEAHLFIDLVFKSLSFFASKGYQLNNKSIETAKRVCYSRLEIYTNNGWSKKKREITNDEVIEETMFFYPLVGMLNDLCDAIAEENK